MVTSNKRHGFWLALLVAGCAPSEPEALLVHCGGGLRLPVAELIDTFEQAHGVRIAANYDGSERLLGAFLVSQRGDVMVPGDRHYLDLLAEKDLVESRRSVCLLVPVILVARTSSHPIDSLPDLLKPGVKLGLGDERACAIGRISRELFEKNGLAWTSVVSRLAYNAGKVDELGQHVEVGSLDAAIIWDSTARQFDRAGRVIEIPPDRNITSTVEAGVLRTAQQPERARAFIDFLASDEGRAVFEKHGFRTALAGEAP